MFKRLFLFIALACITIGYSQQSYYNDVNLNLTGITLKEELATKIISTHTQFLFYDQIWDASKATDVNPNNNNEVLLIYGYENSTDADVTNDRERGIDYNSGDSGDWNREHVFSQSLGVPPLSDSGPGSDAHHLRPADAQRNSSRNNRKFTSGNGNSTAQVNGGWYPGDEWKGDVARMMMYMYVRYGERCLPTNIGFGDNSSTPDDMIDLFLQWNVEDPVSAFEMQRNTYHENTSNQNAQGNRNPFIDNPILATRIWGGPKAEDTWGIYTNSDTEAPSVPINIALSNVTTFSVDVSWSASTDNTATSSYDVFVDGNLIKNTTNTNTKITGLSSNTTYAISVLAKDIANNLSAQSSAVNVTTLQDTEAPSVPINIIISNETDMSFKISWDAATDNTAVTGYEVFIDGNFLASTIGTTYTVTNLTISTSYNVQVLAKDIVDNKSALSTIVIATTTNGSASNATEIFFSEYLEGSSNNKALEIVNLTDADIDLSPYSIKRQSNGGLNNADWENSLQLSGIIKQDDVYVIINGSASIQELIDEADFVQLNASETNWGAPINFNGNDPIGLFKNDILIDIIGTYNGGSSNFAKDKTLRRKSVVYQSNSTFDLDNEWDVYPKDTTDDFGKYYNILNTENFRLKGLKFYPNPTKGLLYIKNLENYHIKEIAVFTILGKKITSITNITNKIDVHSLSKGIYFLKLEIDKNLHTIKFIKK